MNKVFGYILVAFTLLLPTGVKADIGDDVGAHPYHYVPFEGRVLVSVQNNLNVAATFIMKPLFNTAMREIKRGLESKQLTYVEIGYLDAGPYLIMVLIPGSVEMTLIKHVVLDWRTRNGDAPWHSEARQVYQLKLNIPEDFDVPYERGYK